MIDMSSSIVGFDKENVAGSTSGIHISYFSRS